MNLRAFTSATWVRSWTTKKLSCEPLILCCDWARVSVVWHLVQGFCDAMVMDLPVYVWPLNPSMIFRVEVNQWLV